MEVFIMVQKKDFHIIADSQMASKAKELSGLSHRQLFELGCQAAIEQNRNILDAEILELNDAMDRVNELTASIRLRLKDKEVPTKPSDDDNDPEELRRNILPLDLFKEMLFYYMDDFDITELQDLSGKNKEIFRFVLINIAHYNLSMDEINEEYSRLNSE